MVVRGQKVQRVPEFKSLKGAKGVRGKKVPRVPGSKVRSSTQGQGFLKNSFQIELDS